MEMLLVIKIGQRKLHDCIITGEGEGGMMDSREKKLWKPYSCVVVRNTIRISIYCIMPCQLCIMYRF